MTVLDEILSAFLSGERGADEKLFRYTDAKLRSWTRRYLVQSSRSDLDADDLVQEAYLNVLLRPREVPSELGKFFKFMQKEVVRSRVEIDRKKRREPRGIPSELLPQRNIPRVKPDAETLSFEEAFNHLKSTRPKDAEVLEARVFGMQFREIAERQNVSESTVRQRWRSAKEWLARNARLMLLPSTKTDADFKVKFDPELSGAQVKGTLAALADYYRSCGGIGFEVEFGVEESALQ